MSFVAAWEDVRQTVVAICPLFYEEQREFPQIIGTGFLISTEGVVCTCRHVAERLEGLFHPPEFKGIPAAALLFREDPKTPGTWGTVPLNIEGIGSATITGDPSGYRGPNPPDIAYLRLDVCDTPAVALSSDPVKEGEFVAFGGFPMGDALLQAPGWLHQVSPTVHFGMVGAILPVPGFILPHGFLVHANTQGGASGSPVFREDGKVVGMIYLGIQEPRRVLKPDGTPVGLFIKAPTSLTGCVSREMIAQSSAGAHEAAKAAKGRQPLSERIESLRRRVVPRGGGSLDVWDPSKHKR